MNVFQAAKAVDCGELMDRCQQSGRFTGNGRGKWVCPFHDDHHPSMVIYPLEAGKPSHFYCFTCRAHGDATHLYSQLMGLSPLAAARELCRQWSLPYEEQIMKGVNANYQPPMTDDPRLAVVLAICGEWQRYRVKWYEEELEQCLRRQSSPHCASWQADMERIWASHFQTQLNRFKTMTEWEVLQDIRAEFEALGVNPYRRLHIAGTVS